MSYNSEKVELNKHMLVIFNVFLSWRYERRKFKEYILEWNFQFPVSSDAGSVSIAMTNTNILRRILLAFSWRRNFEILFSDLPNYCISDVIEIAGLRVMCLLWILLVHVCTVLYYISGNWIDNSQFHILLNVLW